MIRTGALDSDGARLSTERKRRHAEVSSPYYMNSKVANCQCPCAAVSTVQRCVRRGHREVQDYYAD